MGTHVRLPGFAWGSVRVAGRLIRAYFDRVYTPLYDFTSSQFPGYGKLQAECLEKLQASDEDRVLCIGLGTGNEVTRLLGTSAGVRIVGADYAPSALLRARKKAAAMGGEITATVMDARHLAFAPESFDRVLCIHVMDFVGEHEKIAREVLRVLRAEGRFVITYPSYREGMRLGLALLKDSVRHHIDSGRHPAMAMLKTLTRALGGIVYLPLMFRPGKRSYSRPELEEMIRGIGVGDCDVEEDTVYNDFIVTGIKDRTRRVYPDAI